ncbi:putative dnaJ -like protein subfamily C member 21-like [Capsicum annuum]|nr:putative dnaJ -like protein subfamily C member 21-like [Capsicum annuum]
MLHASEKIFQSIASPMKHNKFPGSHGSGELKSPGAANESPLMNPIMTHPCNPALAHSWNFDIKGAPEFAPGMLNNCIQAYSPSKVRRKVYEFSRLFLGALKFELVPRGAIWTSLFDNHFPGKEDTRLYFLASERERSEMYTALEFLRNKVSVMRMLINDVELVLITKSLIRMNTTRAI